MKKSGRKSIIGGIVALSLILTGTGYAYWTDTLNVTTKATTGEMEVTFVDLGLYAQYKDGGEVVQGGWSIVDGIKRKGTDGFIPDEFFMRGNEDHNMIAKKGSIERYKEEASKYNNVDFDAELVDGKELGKDFTSGNSIIYASNTNSSDKIEITVENMYPGYAQAFRSDILNVGTIAARLSSIKVDAKSMEDKSLQADMLGIAVLVDREGYTPEETEGDTFKLCSMFANGDNYFSIGGVDFLRLSAFEDINEETIVEMLENNLLYAQPGSDNRLDIFLAVGMDPDAEGEYTTGSTKVLESSKGVDADSQNNGAVITIDMLWDQFNEGVKVDSSNILERQNLPR